MLSTLQGTWCWFVLRWKIEKDPLTGIVPGTNDQDHSQGLTTDLAVVERIDELDRRSLRLHPLGEIFNHQGDLRLNHGHLHQGAFDTVLVEIFVDGIGQGLFIFLHQTGEFEQLLFPPALRLGLA